MNRLFLLANQVKNYDWGDPFLIPGFLGQVGDPEKPVAELWMGDNAAGSSSILLDGKSRTLAEWVASDPTRFLGKDLAASGSDRLPFLLKVLAASRALSIQCHPNLAQARAGFAREEESGIGRGNAERNYSDPMNKPEILFALGDFWGLCGFRAGNEIAEDFLRLSGRCGDSGRALCRDFVERARAGDMRTLCSSILGIADPRGLDQIVHAAGREKGERWAFMADAGTHYPGDAGLLFFVVLELFRLSRGQAISIPSGTLHAYLRGMGIEAMANSDNVLRGGLTRKRVDRRELLSVLDSGATPLFLDPEEMDGIRRYDPPSGEFSLILMRNLDGQRTFALPDTGGPGILLCLGGGAVARETNGGELRIGRGQSIIVLPGPVPVNVDVSGEVCLATIGSLLQLNDA